MLNYKYIFLYIVYEKICFFISFTFNNSKIIDYVCIFQFLFYIFLPNKK